jgi:2-keto-4-pentenoate hydratase
VPLRLPEVSTIAAELETAARTRCSIAPPAELAALDLRDAYAIQDALVARHESAGGVRSGWKLGLTSAVKQRLMGIDHPLFGRIFAAGERASGNGVSCAAFIAPRTEPELAFGLAAPLDPGADEALLRRSIAWIAPALEVTDSRYLPGTRSAVELVADNTSAAAYIVGERVPLGEAPPLDAIATQFVRNGKLLAAGNTSHVLGDPLNALRLLAQHLAQRGLATTAGDVILSGAITDAFSIAPGDVFEARLSGFRAAVATFV